MAARGGGGLDLGFLVNIATIFSVVATFAFSVREVLRERRALGPRGRRRDEPAYPEPAHPPPAGEALVLRDARVVTRDGRAELTLSIGFAPAAPAGPPLAAQRPPDRGPAAHPMPAGVPVVNVTGQPLQVQAELAQARQTAGDENAGFYRTMRPMPGWPAGAVVETYKWGRLTAGAAARALWLLLLPLQLANIAMWQRLPGQRLPRYRGSMTVRALCRLFALSLTGSFVLATVGTALDLVAWQCTVPDTRCAANRDWLRPFIEGPLDTPGRRLAVLAVVPVAAIGVLWRLARRTWRDYDSYPVPDVHDAPGGEGLANPLFWKNKTAVGRLRVIHVAAAFAGLDLAIAGTLMTHDESPLGNALTAAAIAILAACAGAVCMPALFRAEPGPRWPTRFVGLVRTAAVLLTALTLGYAVWLPATWLTGPALPGYDRASVWLFVAQLALLGLLALAIAAQHPPAATFGYGAVLFGAVALGTAAAYTGAALYRVADFLSRAPDAGDSGLVRRDDRSVEPATAFQWVGIGFVVLLVLAALAPLALRHARRTLQPAAEAKTDSLFPGRRRLGPRRAAEVDQAIASARLTDRVVSLLGWGSLPLAVVAVTGTGLAVAGIRPVDLARAPLSRRIVETTTDLGTYLIGIAALGLIILGVLAYRNSLLRRIIGVIWDLGTFWPRTCHPLSPPCYAERIVPELVVRLVQLTSPEAGNRGVVLVGQGQGSVLAAATVLQLPAAVRERVALLTVGSPLTRLYARLFPAYLNETVLSDLAARLTGEDGRPRWLNLWRATDPVGGPVAGQPATGPLAGVDRELCDPTGFEFSPEIQHYPRIRGHLDFEADPAFAAAIVELAGRLGAGAAATAAAVPPQRAPDAAGT
jgi:hypothetical protein